MADKPINRDDVEQLAAAFERSANWLEKGWIEGPSRTHPLVGLADYRRVAEILRFAPATAAHIDVTALPAPIDMVLHCPACGLQHVDREQSANECNDAIGWSNPPHRTHLCHDCGHKWRPADVATNGVGAVKTKGKDDSPLVAQRPTLDAVAPIVGRVLYADEPIDEQSYTPIRAKAKGVPRG